MGRRRHGAYNPFEESFGAYDFKLENGRPAPYCLYSQSATSYFAPVGNCFGYVANEWLTFQVGIKLGPRVGDEFKNSFVTLWIAREGKASELVMNWGPYNLTAGSVGHGAEVRQGMAAAVQHQQSSSVTNPIAYTWYDELIISRNKIADP